ncbi:MAG: DUF3168 domain-containing protein [Mesorhizobium sp.]
MTMPSPAIELQKAIFEALSSDAPLLALLGGQKVFDAAPPNVTYPYVSFGRTSMFDWSTGTEIGTEQLFTLHVWSKTRGKNETLEIMAAIQHVLDRGDLAVDHFALVNMTMEFSEARFDDDLLVHHGMVRYRAVLEPAS